MPTLYDTSGLGPRWAQLTIGPCRRVGRVQRTHWPAFQDVLEEPELPKSIPFRNEPVKDNPRNIVICVLDTGDFVVLS